MLNELNLEGLYADRINEKACRGFKRKNFDRIAVEGIRKTMLAMNLMVSEKKVRAEEFS